MLGRLIRKQSWTFSAFGKHPCAGDFFSLNLKTALTTAFVGWTENGYKKIVEKEKGILTQNAFRFWAGGIDKGHVLCGILKDSSDMVGRNHPLLIMGEGALKSWEAQWDLLPFALEDIWSRMEYTAARRVENIHQFESELKNLKAPSEPWIKTKNNFKKGRKDIDRNLKNKIIISDINRKVRQVEQEKTACISLDNSGEIDPFQMAGVWHHCIKNNTRDLPNTVFMGGTPEKSSITFFNRPLMSQDFNTLWLT